MTFEAQRVGGAFEPLRLPLDVRAGNAVVSYLWYVEKAFWPTGLGPFYPHPRVAPGADALGLAAFVGSPSRSRCSRWRAGVRGSRSDGSGSPACWCR